jgi:hypothetical protein
VVTPVNAIGTNNKTKFDAPTKSPKATNCGPSEVWDTNVNSGALSPT